MWRVSAGAADVNRKLDCAAILLFFTDDVKEATPKRVHVYDQWGKPNTNTGEDTAAKTLHTEGDFGV